MTRRPLLFPVALAVIALVGCGGGRYPVAGRVTYEDGSPLPAGTVIGEASVGGKPVSVQGAVRADGSFEWGSDVPGDGALPGEYKVIVQPRALGDAEMGEGKVPDVDGKFTKFDSSGLTYTVKPERNTFDITVTRPKPKGK
jgi:hypothetical protein